MVRLYSPQVTNFQIPFPISFFYFFVFAFLVTTLHLQTSHCFAQQHNLYDNDLLPPSFHKHRRVALRSILPPKSVAVFFSNPVRNRFNDIDFRYHQDPNFYYLTGFTEPNALLLVFKDKFEYSLTGKEGEKTDLFSDEFLFVQAHDSSAELWRGMRLGPDGVKKTLEMDAVLSGRDFADFKMDLASFDRVFLIPPPEDVSDDKNDPGDLYSLIKHFRLKQSGAYDRTDSLLLREFMASLREIKTREELALMQKAIDITCSGINEVMRSLDTSFNEYQVQAMVEFFFHYYGAECPGFPSIIGGGENTCVLHYTLNRKPLKPGDLVIVDVGAEYHGYSADVTRTLPVSGKFTPEQKTIYNIVLEAQQAGIAHCKPGIKFWEPGEKATEVVKKRLKESGIIKSEADYRKYFMHGTSHYLGLDVHDVGLYGNLKPGNVITVEPGIYIKEGSPCDPKWWNTGVRIEDDVLVTENGCVVLSTSPASADEIEKMMSGPGTLNFQK